MLARSVLILGGAGFIGTHLARQLRESGLCERIISLDIQRPQHPVPRVIYNTHDVRQPIHRTIDGHFDIVFNLAAIHRTPGHLDWEYYDTNVAGALNCVAFCERNDIDQIFFTSSISVYGPSEAPLDETSPLNPNSAYGRSKMLAEQIQREWLERSPQDRQLRIVRPAVVFGQGENGNYTLLAKMLKRGIFAFPGRKDTLKAGGYVKELVRTMLFALARREAFYLYNFADRRIPTIHEICAAFAEFDGFRPPLGVVPKPALDAAAGIFELLNSIGFRNPMDKSRVAKLTNSTNIVPRRLILDDYPFVYSLQSAIGDWIAADPEVRPPEAKGRPVSVPDFEFTRPPPILEPALRSAVDS